MLLALAGYEMLGHQLRRSNIVIAGVDHANGWAERTADSPKVEGPGQGFRVIQGTMMRSTERPDWRLCERARRSRTRRKSNCFKKKFELVLTESELGHRSHSTDGVPHTERFVGHNKIRRLTASRKKGGR
jgi:hypothetical protein